MANTLSHEQLAGVITKVNSSLNVNLDVEDFKAANYSESSLQDILVSKVADELRGEWTTDMAFHKLRTAISKIRGTSPASITQDTELAQIFPKPGRKAQMKKLDEAMGFPLDILKPNSAVYGILIFLFFACIPFGIGMDWFFSGIAMLVIALLLFILGKTGSDFKMKTVGHLADHLAWKNYLKQKKGASAFSDDEIKRKVDAILA